MAIFSKPVPPSFAEDLARAGINISKRKSSDVASERLSKKRSASLGSHVMNDAVRAKQMACALAPDVTLFLSVPVADASLVNFALYPQARADTELSRTEKEMRKVLDADVSMAWIDFCCLSSDTTNAIIDQDAIAKLVDEEDVLVDYHRRFVNQLRVGATDPCVYVAGKTCERAFDAMIELGLISRLETIDSLGVSLCETEGRRFIALEGRPHPSWHLMTAQAPGATAAFRETMDMINGVLHCRAAGEIGVETLTRFVLEATRLDPEILRARDEGRKWLTRLLYGRDTGRFPARDMHLRNVPVHLPGVKAMIEKWHAREKDVLLHILRSGNLYLDLPSYDGLLEAWFVELGPARFVTFLCNSVAARLGEETFELEARWWLAELGPARFVTFMCDSVAARLGDETFDREAHWWRAELGDARFVTFMCNSVAARLGDETFDREARWWRAELGPARFVTFLRDSVAARLGEDTFDREARWWRSELGDARFVTFLRDSVAARLGEETFELEARWWRAELGDARFVRFMCGSAAARLGAGRFNKRARFWMTVLGKDRFVTFMRDCVACRLEDDDFHALLVGLHEDFGKQFQTILCGSFAKRLGRPVFDVRVRFWRKELGKKAFVAFICDGVAARLEEDEFHQLLLDLHKTYGIQLRTLMTGCLAAHIDDDLRLNMDYWRKTLGKRFVTIMKGSFVKRLAKEPGFHEAMIALHEKLGDAFVTFISSDGVASRVCGGEKGFDVWWRMWLARLGGDMSLLARFMGNEVASRFESEAFNDTALGLFDRAGKKNFVRLYSIGGFAGRIMNEGVAADLEIAIEMEGGDAVYTLHNRNRGKKLNELMGELCK